MKLTDTHCHLDFHQFDPDREAALERAALAGVGRILIPGVTLLSSRSAVKLAESHPMLYAAVGLHPTEAGEWTTEMKNQLETLARSCAIEGGSGKGKVVAIGEIGLDYYWDSAPHPLQQRVLQEQLNLAAELYLPVVIHCREKGDAVDGDCASDLLRILEVWTAGLQRQNHPIANRPGVLHSFSGSRQTAQKALDMNFYIGITGPVTYKNAESKREVVKSLPLERLLIETDAPFLAPALHRGKRNEPAFVNAIADKIAQLHSRSLEEVAAITSRNATQLFSWGETF